MDSIINFYRSLHKWDEAIAVAEAKGIGDVSKMKSDHKQWLQTTGQDEKAGEVKLLFSINFLISLFKLISYLTI